MFKYLCVFGSFRRGIKNTVFFGVSLKRGGRGLAEAKISLSEKTEIFVGFFLPKGGGSHLFQEGFYHKILIFVIKYSVFFLEIFRNTFF